MWRTLCLLALINARTNALSAPEVSLARLLLQRSVQTQVVYLTEFHDQMKAEWVSQFGSPCAPLGTVRLSQRECKPEYHGLDGMTEWHADNYLRSMLAAEPENYEVRYAVGTADMVEMPMSGEGMDAEAARAAMEMWGHDDVGRAAAASRRRNPFLQDSKQYRTYAETIVPARCAQLIMRTREQIATEWAVDLNSIGLGEFDRYLSCLDQDDEVCDALHAYSDDGLETAYALTVRAAPIRTTFEDSVNSPLRVQNLDLCDRLATREAAAAAVGSGLSRSESEWLATKLKLEEREPSTGDAVLDELRAAACKLVDVDALSGHARRKGLAIRWLRDLEDEDAPADVDPYHVATVVRERRISMARDWAQYIVDYVKKDDQRLLKESLEAQLDHALLPNHLNQQQPTAAVVTKSNTKKKKKMMKKKNESSSGIAAASEEANVTSSLSSKKKKRSKKFPKEEE